MTPTFDSLEALGWKLIREEEGHNLQKIYTTIEKAIIETSKNPAQPVAIVFKRLKDMGYNQLWIVPVAVTVIPYRRTMIN